MAKLDLIEAHEFLKIPHDETELCVVKEWLLKQIDRISKERETHGTKALEAGIPMYIRVIFINKLREREEHLRHLLREVLFEIREKEKARKAQ